MSDVTLGPTLVSRVSVYLSCVCEREREGGGMFVRDYRSTPTTDSQYGKLTNSIISSDTLGFILHCI